MFFINYVLKLDCPSLERLGIAARATVTCVNRSGEFHRLTDNYNKNIFLKKDVAYLLHFLTTRHYTLVRTSKSSQIYSLRSAFIHRNSVYKNLLRLLKTSPMLSWVDQIQYQCYLFCRIAKYLSYLMFTIISLRVVFKHDF